MRVEVTKMWRMTMNSNLEELLVNKGHLTGESRWLRRNRYYTLSVLHSFFHQHCSRYQRYYSICLEFIWLLGWNPAAGLKWKRWNTGLGENVLMFLLLISFIGQKNSVLDFWFNSLLSYKWRMLRTNLFFFSCQFDLIWRKTERSNFLARKRSQLMRKHLNWMPWRCFHGKMIWQVHNVHNIF